MTHSSILAGGKPDLKKMKRTENEKNDGVTNPPKLEAKTGLPLHQAALLTGWKSLQVHILCPLHLAPHIFRSDKLLHKNLQLSCASAAQFFYCCLVWTLPEWLHNCNFAAKGSRHKKNTGLFGNNSQHGGSPQSQNFCDFTN